jgi:hypothetical protein
VTGDLVDVGDACLDVRLADLDGDGVAELISSLEAPGVVNVLAGMGQGGFGPGAGYVVANGTSGIDVADVNGDGALDVAAASGNANDVVSVLLGQGDGTLGDPLRVPVADVPWSVTARDMDADGLTDLVTCHWEAGLVARHRNAGHGRFVTEQTIESWIPDEALVEDLDANGWPDVVVTTWGSTSVMVSVFMAAGPDSLRLEAVHDVAGIGSGGAIGDVTGDGANDFVAGGSYEGDDGLTLLIGRGDGSWASGLVAPAGPSDSPASLYSLVAETRLADANGDGSADLTATHAFGSDFVRVVRPGHGDGSFGAALVSLLPFGFGSHARPGDVDGDGLLDFVTTDPSQSALFPSGLVAMLGDGSGLFVPGPTLEIATIIRDVDLGDLDGDGDDDAVALGSLPAVLTSLSATGGAFAPFPPVALSGNPVGALGDVDADGTLDAVTSSALWIGLGNGQFAPPQPVDLGNPTEDLVLADLDADGWLDVAATGSLGQCAIVTRALGQGTFGPPVTYAGGEGARDIEVDDIDGGGVPDLVLANYGSKDVAILLGHGDATFAPARAFATGQSTVAVHVADLNEDGWNDVVVGVQGESVDVRLNLRGPWTDLGYGGSSAGHWVAADRSCPARPTPCCSMAPKWELVRCW